MSQLMNPIRKPTNRETFDQLQEPHTSTRPQAPPSPLPSPRAVSCDDTAIQNFMDQIECMKVGTDIADYLLPIPDDSDLP